MKKLTKKIFFIPAILLLLLVAFIIVFDTVIMPWYVSSKIVEVPNVIGKHKKEAVQILKTLKLEPIEKGPRYDLNMPEDHILLQKPNPGKDVKEGRRIYLYVSGGDPLIKMPSLVGKTMRDAKITIERLGLKLGKVEDMRSEFPANLIVEQEIPEGENVAKGDSIDLKVSVGPQVGMIRVPSLIAKSLTEAEKILRDYSLRVGKKTYIHSPNLLPNTIVDQIPSENSLVAVGDSIDVVLTQTKTN